MSGARLRPEIAGLLDVENPVAEDDVVVNDAALAPGYGQINDAVREAVRLCASREGLLLDPVYTGKTMATLIAMLREGAFDATDHVLFVHTGGLPAIFAYPEMLDAAAA